MMAALWGPGSGAPITLAGLVALAIGVAVAAYLTRRRPDLLERLDEWMERHL